jgi:hypothetical protein
MLSVCLYIPPNKYSIAEPVFIKLGMCITAPDPVSAASFINPSHQSVCLYAYPPNVAGQRLCQNVTTATNTHATIEELLDASLCGPCPMKK